MKKVLGITKNNLVVYDGTEIGGHVHADVNPQDLCDAIAKINLNGFARETVELDHVVGVDHLVETKPYDVTYMYRRGNRAGESRMVLTREPEYTHKITVIMCVCRAEAGEEWADKAVVITAFAGALAEKEPWDSSLKTSEEKAKAKAFWATHALVPTDEEEEAINKLMAMI